MKIHRWALFTLVHRSVFEHVLTNIFVRSVIGFLILGIKVVEKIF